MIRATRLERYAQGICGLKNVTQLSRVSSGQMYGDNLEEKREFVLKVVSSAI